MDNITSEQRVSELTSDLYYDLLDKYILLKQERDFLANRNKNIGSKLRKLSHDIGYVKATRKYFNFGIKLAIKKIEEIAIANKLDLELAVSLVDNIKLLKKSVSDINSPINIE